MVKVSAWTARNFQRCYFLEPINIQCFRCKGMIRVISAVPTSRYYAHPQLHRFTRIFIAPLPECPNCGKQSQILLYSKETPFVVALDEAHHLFDILATTPTLEK